MKYCCKIFPFFAVEMRSHSITRFGITLFLLLIFFQQIGGGLFIHNLLHTKNEVAQNAAGKNESSNEIKFACSCVDDFLVPFIGTSELPALQNPLIHAPFTVAYIERIYSSPHFFSSLRGPPSLIG